MKTLRNLVGIGVMVWTLAAPPAMAQAFTYLGKNSIGANTAAFNGPRGTGGAYISRIPGYATSVAKHNNATGANTNYTYIRGQGLKITNLPPTH